AGWLSGVCWKPPGAAARAALALMLRERGVAGTGMREVLGALQLAPPELKPAARELDGLLRQGAALLGEGGASPRRWSERFEAALAAVGWPGDAPADSASHQTRLRWREPPAEFCAVASPLPTLFLRHSLH